MVKPVCVRPNGWSLRWFCHRDWQPQALARSDLPRASSFRRCEIDWPLCAHNNRLLLFAATSLVASASASLTSGDRRLGSKVALAFLLIFFLNRCLVAAVYRRPPKEGTSIPRWRNRTQKSPLGASAHHLARQPKRPHLPAIRPCFW